MERAFYFISAFGVLLPLLNCQMPFLVVSYTSLATDQSALLALKAHITIDPYRIITSNWTNSSSICTWIGVTCSPRHHRVTALNISYMDVTGAIPPQVGSLSFLISLDLRYNHFNGNLPQELSHLHRLKFLALRANNFSGVIPSWLGFLTKLEYLTLRNNSFTGSIPNSISKLSNLEVLDFSYNSLQGTIPQELANLGSLQVLSMQFNHLSGPIPSAIFNLSTLESIAFTSVELNGSLPTNICRNLPFVEGIYLSYNQLTGQIPSSLFKCAQLQTLSLSYNFLSGQIPKDIGKYLEVLYLGGNNLTGIIPPEIGNLQNLVGFAIEQNQITGAVPLNIFNISSLQLLHLRDNKLTGSLPKDIGNLTMLKYLILSDNNLTGVLPQEIGQLYQLEEFSAGSNSFTGSIPPELFNISTLQTLALTMNGLVGNLPTSLGYGLPVLEKLLLNDNNFGGVIPDSISNCSKLRILSLSSNKFIGYVPQFFGNLRLLERLQLFENNLRIEPSSPEMSFITSLTKCRFLNHLAISHNPLKGIIPTSIGNLSTSFQNFYAFDCKIMGIIPTEIGNLSNLMTLALTNNELTGNIPLSVKDLDKLQGLFLENNNMRGSIPEGLCHLHALVEIYLSQNQFSGPIPECLGNITSLRLLALKSNKLTSSIPSSFWRLKDLLELDLSSNSLSEFLPPEIGNLVIAININLSMNQLSGYIPSTIGNLQNLASLSLGYNRLQGSIPVSMGSMINLETLDLSYNNLSGSIPKSLQALEHLKYFNVSFNALIGEIPTGGPFRNFTVESFKANKALCGIKKFHVPPCHTVSKHGSRRRRVHFALFILFGVIACIMAVSLAYIFIRRYRRKDKVKSGVDTLIPAIHERISYYELLRATEHFSESNLLGKGSFGSVYKGTLSDGKIIAVKVFNLQLEAAFKSFEVECEVLRGIRHRNLTKVISSCSTEDFKALILEYMPNGNLEKWLYSHNYCLDVLQRLNIMIDVASAMEYLHYGYSTPIVHCDLKPSNVLLDEEMIAHVSDFGMAKLMGEGLSIAHTSTIATLGYIAPVESSCFRNLPLSCPTYTRMIKFLCQFDIIFVSEYGLEGLVSTRCDVHSYGVMLMETFTRKRPSDEIFAGDLSLKIWVEGLLPRSPNKVIDANLLYPETEHFERNFQCISSILELALRCSTESPENRMNIKEVLAELRKIKCRFLA